MTPASPPGERPHPDYLVLGEVLRPHGINGELRTRILTDYPERMAKLDTVYLGKGPDNPDVTAFAVEHMRMHTKYGLLKLGGVDDRGQAELLRAFMVMVHIDDAIPLEADEHYLYEFIGVTVQTTDGQVLGPISHVLETGANDVYIVQSSTYGEVLIPVTDETIVRKEIESGLIVVKLPDGLLPSA